VKVLILHTLPPENVGEKNYPWEFDLNEAVSTVASVLPGAIVEGVRGDAQEVIALISGHNPDVVFNVCEAPLGRPDLESQLAGLLELLGVRFTGSGSETLALCRRKDRVNAVLERAGVNVPRRGVFPCIVKPADQDGSNGLDSDSICDDEAAVERARARITGPVVIEEFLPGREFTVSLWGCVEPEYTWVAETLFREGLRLITYESKWNVDSPDQANAPVSFHPDLDPALRNAVVETARAAWRAVEARGYIRVDLRLDGDGVPRVIDVNPNPELYPEQGVHRAVSEAGWTWEQFVGKLIEWA
jgi:D-alanine-D-alanine ligase